MSASNEYWIWHLTPRGWEKGTEKLDFGGTKRTVPPGTVLTLKYHEYWSSIYSSIERWIDTEIKDQTEAENLKRKYGSNPPEMSKFKCTK